jgi:hypothetical protein
LALALIAWASPPPTASAAKRTAEHGTVIVEVSDREGGPLGPGMKVYDGYEPVAVTGRTNRARLRLAPGVHRITVVDPGMRAGSATVDVRSGATRPVTISLDRQSLLEAFPVQLRLDQGPIIEPTLSVISGAFYDDRGRKVKLRDLRIGAANDKVVLALSDLIMLSPDGSFRTRPGADLTALTNLDGRTTILAYGTTPEGHPVWDRSVKVAVGRYRVFGRMMPPPSEPGLDVGNLSFDAILVTDDTLFRHPISVTTSPNGTFEINKVPPGTVNIQLKHIQSNETTYYLGSWIDVVADTTVLVRILSAFEERLGYRPINILVPESSRAYYTSARSIASQMLPSKYDGSVTFRRLMAARKPLGSYAGRPPSSRAAASPLAPQPLAGCRSTVTYCMFFGLSAAPAP